MSLKRPCIFTFFLALFCSLTVSDSWSKSESGSHKIYIVFRIDDYGIDNARFYDQLTEVVKRTDCRLTLAVVPFRKSDNTYVPLPDSLSSRLNGYIKNDSGIELALHGYAHENLLVNDYSSEFYGQSYARQQKMIHEGKTLLESKLATRITTFIPPWNTFDNTTTDALTAEGFDCISAASYGRITTRDLNPRLRYAPYTIQLAALMDSYPLCIPENKGGISVVLFHAYDFVEGQPLSNDNHSLDYLAKNRKITLDEFEQFVNRLKENPRIVFCTFKDICNNQNNDLSVNRYKSSFISVIIQPFWPRLTFESFLYLNNGDFNIRNAYNLIWPFIFYGVILLSGYLVSLKAIFRRIRKNGRMLIIAGLTILVFTILSVFTFRHSLRFIMLFFFWIGIVLGYARTIFMVSRQAYGSKKGNK